MGAFIGRDGGTYAQLRDLALLQNSEELKDLVIGEDEPYKVLIEFYVEKVPVTVFCAIDGTASLYLNTGAGFINGGAENETIRQIAKSAVFEAKNIAENMEAVADFPEVEEGKVNVYVVTDRNIYRISARQEAAAQKESEIWKLYYLAIEIISMYMNS